MAARALESAALHEGFTLGEVGDWVAGLPASEGASQAEANIAEPSVRLLESRAADFVVDLYLWSDLDTAAHDHSSGGAICQLAGNTMHARYRFAEAPGRAQSDMKQGTLSLDSIERLEPGHVYPLAAGAAFIHQTFHLTRPTASLIIRGRNPRVASHGYWHAGFALSRDVLGSIALHKRVRLFEFFEKAQPALASDYLCTLIRESPLAVAVTAFLRIVEMRGRSAVSGRLHDAIAARRPWQEEVDTVLDRIEATAMPRGLACQLAPDEKQLLVLMKLTGFGDEMMRYLARHHDGLATVDTLRGWLRGLALRRALRPQLVGCLYAATERPTCAATWHAHLAAACLQPADQAALDAWNAGRLVDWPTAA
jgi:hypothetical protein